MSGADPTHKPMKAGAGGASPAPTFKAMTGCGCSARYSGVGTGEGDLLAMRFLAAARNDVLGGARAFRGMLRCPQCDVRTGTNLQVRPPPERSHDIRRASGASFDP